ncbi:MAG: flagellar biosynthesis protein FliA, partial [Roseiflexaceae bacterium]|nr:flagellar biosynthesis protein FliA [Roseiflexaceae bacterium]
ELDADPGAPAAALLRRVQSRMAQIGTPAPRSSFYRLLAQLRGDEATAQGRAALDGPLREALGDLAEDPPLALGKGSLASLLLPDVRDPLTRGRWLKRALHTAIERLRPAEAGSMLDDTRWRHYLIIAGEYETGDSRNELQQALALSASTYSRAKREAVNRLDAMLPSIAADMPPPAPPTAVISPPPAPEVSEHEPELERYLGRLRRDGQVLIWGADGVGKTALAASLAARLLSRGQKVVWHTARSAELDPRNGYNLLLTLAAGLNIDGLPELWSQMSDPAPLPFTRWLEVLVTGLTERHWTVVVDNLHRLTDREAERVLDVLLRARDRRDLRLVLVTRELPAWADSARWPALPHPEDASGRRAFLALLDAHDGVVLAPADERAALLREKVAELLAVLAPGDFAQLPHYRRAAVLQELQPLLNTLKMITGTA